MRKFALTLAVLLQANAALALSCKPPNFADDFDRIARAVELYSVAYGTLRLAGPLQSYVTGEAREVLFEFNGKLLGRRGEKVTREVLLRTECTGSWCGQIPPEGQPMLMFLQNERAGLSLRSGACSGDFYINPSLGKVAAIRACMRKGLCGDAEREAFDLTR